MSLPEQIKSFIDESPISLVAKGGGPLSEAEIKSFYESEISSYVQNQKYGQLCYAGLLMAQDYIWEAHEIVQGYPEVEASWWHAFMHRMEGDYGNSAYWYRRVGEPGNYASLLTAVQNLEFSTEASTVLDWDSWDSFKFNDLIASSSGDFRDELHDIHRLECLLLIKICYIKAKA